MSTESKQDVILDTCVLLNFVKIGRVDLLCQHPCYRFVVTNHVRNEVTNEYPEQIALVQQAIKTGGLEEIEVIDAAELAAYGGLQSAGRIGEGECSAIVVAATRRLPLAIDDKRARKEAHRFLHSINFVGTDDIMVSLVRDKVLDLATADATKDDWERNHRFKLAFQSFAERV